MGIALAWAVLRGNGAYLSPHRLASKRKGVHGVKSRTVVPYSAFGGSSGCSALGGTFVPAYIRTLAFLLDRDS